jgi:hypothetical protein
VKETRAGAALSMEEAFAAHMHEDACCCSMNNATVQLWAGG